MKVLIDGKEIIDKQTLHLYLREKLNLPEYYGNNLDALWDVLSTYNEDLEITIINIDDIKDNLGIYGQSLIKLLEQVSEERNNIKLITK